MYVEDTIAAIATPVGSGGIGIIRVSGSGASGIAERIFARKGNGGFESHRFYYGHIIEPADSSLIDEGMAVLMRSPRSYTREDVGVSRVVCYCHGCCVGKLITGAAYKKIKGIFVVQWCERYLVAGPFRISIRNTPADDFFRGV